MNDDSLLMFALTEAARRRGEGLSPELQAAMQRDAQDATVEDAAPAVVRGAEIHKLPGLHQRPVRITYGPAQARSAEIIPFPAPRWQKNAQKKSG